MVAALFVEDPLVRGGRYFLRRADPELDTGPGAWLLGLAACGAVAMLGYCVVRWIAG